MISFKEQQDKPEEVKDLLIKPVKTWFFSKFKEFSLPQLYGVSEIHSRNNTLISAPTGATKTLTAFLSILNELIDLDIKGLLENKVYCVYISPLKALNEDIKFNLLQPLKEIEDLYGKKLNIRVGVRTGDTSQSEKSSMLKNPPHIFITTPESLAISLASKKFKEALTGVQWCIIDEIHSLAENKRGVHLSLSLERLENLSGHLTRIGLSATVAPLEEVAQFLVGNRDCKIINIQFLKEMDLKVLSPVNDLINTSFSKLHNETYRLINDLIHQHKTTLIFTNTRAATERVVHYLKDMFPNDYNDVNIGAHHGSLSKEHRSELEQNLREGRLKCVVCSTSLELGIDIGFIDLVILLGSPKSVARALQRIGRSGHQLHATTKGRIIVLDRDDLVECSVLLKSAIEKKIDRIHVPKNCLDVLTQHVHGAALEDTVNIDKLYNIFKQSYCYQDLKKTDFQAVVDYLSGKHVELEERHVYAKIWQENNEIGKKGKLSRVIHMTNIGTIPTQGGIKVKVKDRILGMIDESFLERLKPGDVFVLGGLTYTFKHSRGMTAQVELSMERPPTVPSWVSESLPLSFDLANDIGRFKRLIEEKFEYKIKKQEIINFINEYLYIDQKAAEAIYQYFNQQYKFCKNFGSDNKIVVEHYIEDNENYTIFHTMFGRRVNDCLSRSLAFVIGRTQHRDVEISINDNGFYIKSNKKVNVMKAFELILGNDIDKVLKNAIEGSEVLKRRFRHCAERSLMILRNYKGREKNAGRQQISSMLLLNAVKRIDPNFFILNEARREVLEDLMDIQSFSLILDQIKNNQIEVKEISTNIPSPLSFNILLQGRLDIMKIEDKFEFLRRMHNYVLASIGQKYEDIE